MAITGRFTGGIHSALAGPTITKLADAHMELRRVMLLDRVNSKGKENYNPNALQNHFKNEREILNSKTRTRIIAEGNTDKGNSYYKGDIVKDVVTIIDIDADGLDKGVKYIQLPFIPKELNWNTESQFVSIKGIGRNNPKYHFLGAEDRLEFEIDWHSMDANRDDVIKNCRLIEALSKNDGYNNPPHRVLIQWGEEDVLFKDMVFLVVSAPYRLTQFNKAQFRNNLLQKTAMLPIQAYQKVSLARITPHNLSSREIQTVNSIKYY